MKGLSPKQEAFCMAYIKCGNATEAYKQAGYKGKNERVATSSANRMLTNVDILSRIDELKAEVATPKIMTAQQRRETLSEIAWNKEARESDRINAMNVLNKMDALYLQRQEVSVQGAIPIVIADNVRE